MGLFHKSVCSNTIEIQTCASEQKNSKSILQPSVLKKGRQDFREMQVPQLTSTLPEGCMLPVHTYPAFYQMRQVPATRIHNLVCFWARKSISASPDLPFKGVHFPNGALASDTKTLITLLSCSAFPIDTLSATLLFASVCKGRAEIVVDTG